MVKCRSKYPEAYGNNWLYLNIQMLILLTEFLYHFILETVTKKGSLGHRITGIRVLSNQMEHLSIGRLLIRSLIKSLSRYFLCIPMASMLFIESRQAFHDIIVRSVAVSDQ